MRAELDALLTREEEAKEQIAERMQQLEESVLMVSDGVQRALQGGPGDAGVPSGRRLT